MFEAQLISQSYRKAYPVAREGVGTKVWHYIYFEKNSANKVASFNPLMQAMLFDQSRYWIKHHKSLANLNYNGLNAVMCGVIPGNLAGLKYLEQQIPAELFEQLLNEKNIDGHTPLMMAVLLNNREVFSWLIKKNVNINLVDKLGRNAALYAVLNDDEKTLCEIIKHEKYKPISDVPIMECFDSLVQKASKLAPTEKEYRDTKWILILLTKYIKKLGGTKQAILNHLSEASDNMVDDFLRNIRLFDNRQQAIFHLLNEGYVIRKKDEVLRNIIQNNPVDETNQTILAYHLNKTEQNVALLEKLIRCGAEYFCRFVSPSGEGPISHTTAEISELTSVLHAYIVCHKQSASRHVIAYLIKCGARLVNGESNLVALLAKFEFRGFVKKFLYSEDACDKSELINAAYDGKDLIAYCDDNNWHREFESVFLLKLANQKTVKGMVLNPDENFDGRVNIGLIKVIYHFYQCVMKCLPETKRAELQELHYFVDLEDFVLSALSFITQYLSDYSGEENANNIKESLEKYFISLVWSSFRAGNSSLLIKCVLSNELLKQLLIRSKSDLEPYIFHEMCADAVKNNLQIIELLNMPYICSIPAQQYFLMSLTKRTLKGYHIGSTLFDIVETTSDDKLRLDFVDESGDLFVESLLSKINQFNNFGSILSRESVQALPVQWHFNLLKFAITHNYSSVLKFYFGGSIPECCPLAYINESGENLLYLLVSSSHASEMKGYIQAVAAHELTDVNVTTSEGVNPIALMIVKRLFVEAHVVLSIRSFNWDVLSLPVNGVLPINQLIRYKSSILAIDLIDNKVNLAAFDGNDVSPLMAAIIHENDLVFDKIMTLPPAELLVNLHSDTHYSVLHVAIAKGKLSSVQRLIEIGAMLHFDVEGVPSVINHAIASRASLVACHLVNNRKQYGIDITFVDSDGATALEKSVEHYQGDVFDLLLRCPEIYSNINLVINAVEIILYKTFTKKPNYFMRKLMSMLFSYAGEDEVGNNIIDKCFYRWILTADASSVNYLFEHIGKHQFSCLMHNKKCMPLLLLEMIYHLRRRRIFSDEDIAVIERTLNVSESHPVLWDRNQLFKKFMDLIKLKQYREEVSRKSANYFNQRSVDDRTVLSVAIMINTPDFLREMSRLRFSLVGKYGGYLDVIETTIDDYRHRLMAGTNPGHIFFNMEDGVFDISNHSWFLKFHKKETIIVKSREGSALVPAPESLPAADAVSTVFSTAAKQDESPDNSFQSLVSLIKAGNSRKLLSVLVDIRDSDESKLKQVDESGNNLIYHILQNSPEKFIRSIYTISTLLKAGVSANSQNATNGKTLLMYLIELGRVNSSCCLLTHLNPIENYGIDKLDVNGKSVVDYAISACQFDVLDELLSKRLLPAGIKFQIHKPIFQNLNALVRLFSYNPFWKPTEQQIENYVSAHDFLDRRKIINIYWLIMNYSSQFSLATLNSLYRRACIYYFPVLATVTARLIHNKHRGLIFLRSNFVVAAIHQFSRVVNKEKLMTFMSEKLTTLTRCISPLFGKKWYEDPLIHLSSDSYVDTINHYRRYKMDARIQQFILSEFYSDTFNVGRAPYNCDHFSSVASLVLGYVLFKKELKQSRYIFDELNNRYGSAYIDNGDPEIPPINSFWETLDFRSDSLTQSLEEGGITTSTKREAASVPPLVETAPTRKGWWCSW